MSLVQSNSGNIAPGNPLSVAFTSAVASGDILVAGFIVNFSGIPAISDSLGNTWTKLVAAKRGNGDENAVTIWSASPAKSGNTTVKFSGNTGSDTASAVIFELNGYSGVVAVGSGGATSTTPSVPSISFRSGAFSLGLLLAPMGVSDTYTPTASFTVVSGNSTGGNFEPSEYANTLAAGSTTFAWTLSSSASWAECAVTMDVNVASAAAAAFWESGPKRQYRRGERQR